MFNYYKRWNKRELMQLFLWFFGILMIGVTYLSLTSFYLYQDKKMEDKYWDKYLYEHDKLNDKEKTQAKNATRVKTGIYIENIDNLDIKNSNYTVTFKVWFSWKNNEKLDMINNYEIYHGEINHQKLIKETVTGNTKYQLSEVSATINKVFWTTRFPLGSYQLRIYIEPNQGINNLLIVPDKDQSSVNENLNVSGFTPVNFAVNRCLQKIDVAEYFSDTSSNSYTCSEFLTSLELNRKGIGLYLKCFIALVGTLGWVLITLFICTYHEVDPLGMIPSALFGSVSNILVGANLVPDAIQTGLIEFVNVYGVLIIILVALTVIKINRTREYYGNNEFAFCLGRHIFWLTLFLALVGNILLPVMAYKF